MTKDALLKELEHSEQLKEPLVRAAFYSVDRKDFILPEYAAEAYENRPLPIGYNQTISQPFTVAFMLALLSPKPGNSILDIGAGSGWQTALLAHIAGKNGTVCAVERIPELCEFAKVNLEKYGYISDGTVEFFCGDATRELFKGRKFDRIIAAASASREIPAWWRGSLAVGGRIVAPIDESIWLYEKTGENEWKETEHEGFLFVPLIANDKRRRKK